MRRWSRNDDRRIRELERAVRETWAPDAAARLYWEQVRARGPRQSADSPEFEIEIPKFGPVRMLLQGDAVRVMGIPDPSGHGEIPVVVNRVRYTVSGAYFLIDPYGWIPFDPDSVRKQEQSGFSGERRVVERFKDPTYRYQNRFSLRRLGWTDWSKSEATDSAFRKFMTAFDRAIQAWIADHPDDMRTGFAIAANNDLVRLQEDMAKVREELTELELQAAEHVMTELRNR